MFKGEMFGGDGRDLADRLLGLRGLCYGRGRC